MFKDKHGKIVHMTEDESLDVMTFTNIDKEEFVGIWGGKPTTIKPGETKALPRFKAMHFCKHLVTKILISQGKKYTSDLIRKPLEEKIIGSLDGAFEKAKDGETSEDGSQLTDDPKGPDNTQEDEFSDIKDESNEGDNSGVKKAKPLEEWKKDDLEILAEEHEIDISGAKNKKEMVEIIKAALVEKQKGTEGIEE